MIEDLVDHMTLYFLYLFPSWRLIVILFSKNSSTADILNFKYYA